MDSETCPTVRVVAPASPGGYVVINEADFNPSVHTKFTGARIPLRNPAQPPQKGGKVARVALRVPKGTTPAPAVAVKAANTPELGKVRLAVVKDELDRLGVEYDTNAPLEELEKLLPAKQGT